MLRQVMLITIELIEIKAILNTNPSKLFCTVKGIKRVQNYGCFDSRQMQYISMFIENQYLLCAYMKKKIYRIYTGLIYCT